MLTNLREEFFISRSSAADESKLLEEDVLSLTSSDPAGSALLAHGQEWADEGGEHISELSQPVCPAYVELLEVMEHATARLDLQWRHEKGEWLAVDLMSDFSLDITSQLP